MPMLCRVLPFALLTLVSCQRSQKPPIAGNPVPPPPTLGLELQQEDFAQARQTFRTKLLRSGPSPQQSDALELADDAKEVEYASGQLKLKAWVSPPAQDKKLRPAVLFLHGGFAFGEDDWDMAKPFRDAGFVVMTPMLRGENGQPGAYTMFYDEVEDVLAARDTLAKQPNVDETRIFVAGHSAGGTLTLLAAMASKGFRAAASIGASPDQIDFLEGQENLAPFDQNDIREFQLRSPVAYATSFKCPVRIYYGSQDGFRLGSLRTAILAKEKGLNVEADEIPGNHFTSVPPAMESAIEFFTKAQ